MGYSFLVLVLVLVLVGRVMCAACAACAACDAAGCIEFWYERGDGTARIPKKQMAGANRSLLPATSHGFFRGFPR
jgi:hypothetical protein